MKMIYFKTLLLLGIILFIASCKKKDGVERECSITIDPTNTLYCSTINKATTVNGFIKNYYQNSVDIESEGNYTNGIPTGFWKFYYLNGNLKYEGNYTSQKQDGFCKEYFENGFLKEEGHFTNCVRIGFYKFFHETSQNKVEREGNYTNGVKTGIWKYYDVNGKVLKTIDFKC